MVRSFGAEKGFGSSVSHSPYVKWYFRSIPLLALGRYYSCVRITNPLTLMQADLIAILRATGNGGALALTEVWSDLQTIAIAQTMGAK